MRLVLAVLVVLSVVACSSSSSSKVSLGTKPVVTVPSGPPPTSLVINDLVVGTGQAAATGETLTVQYVGVSYTNKAQFDASWDRNQPFSFQLGGQVIPGWNQGLIGMKVGGRRQLIIPPSLAYGSASPSPQIAANDTLIFVIDLIKIG
jgi:peptidylprolyl isomerase